MAGGVANIHIIYIKNKFNYLSPCLSLASWKNPQDSEVVYIQDHLD